MKKFLALLLCAGFAFAEPIQVPPANSITITAGTSSAATALPPSGVGSQRQVELQNAGSAVIFVEFCPSSTCTAAVATGYPILVGQSKVVTIKSEATHIATISGTASQTLYVTAGIGE